MCLRNSGEVPCCAGQRCPTECHRAGISASTIEFCNEPCPATIREENKQRIEESGFKDCAAFIGKKVSSVSKLDNENQSVAYTETVVKVTRVVPGLSDTWKSYTPGQQITILEPYAISEKGDAVFTHLDLKNNPGKCPVE